MKKYLKLKMKIKKFNKIIKVSYKFKIIKQYQKMKNLVMK